MQYPPLPSTPSASPIYAYPRKCPLPLLTLYPSPFPTDAPSCYISISPTLPLAISHLHFPPSFPTFLSHPSRCCHDQGKTKILQDQGKVSEYPKKSWKFFDIVKVSEKSGNLLALRKKSSQKRQEVENEEKNISGLLRKLNANGKKRDCFSLIKRQ